VGLVAEILFFEVMAHREVVTAEPALLVVSRRGQKPSPLVVEHLGHEASLRPIPELGADLVELLGFIYAYGPHCPLDDRDLEVLEAHDRLPMPCLATALETPFVMQAYLTSFSPTGPMAAMWISWGPTTALILTSVSGMFLPQIAPASLIFTSLPLIKR